MELQRQQFTQSIKKVKGTRTLLVSAYLEHRTGEKQVRVIAVVLRSEKVAYRCLFRCQEKQLLSNGVADIHTDHFGFAYGTADIMCPLPSGCETPSSIAVTSTDANSNSTVQNVNVAMGMLMAMPVCLSIWCLL